MEVPGQTKGTAPFSYRIESRVVHRTADLVSVLGHGSPSVTTTKLNARPPSPPSPAQSRPLATHVSGPRSSPDSDVGLGSGFTLLHCPQRVLFSCRIRTGIRTPSDTVFYPTLSFLDLRDRQDTPWFFPGKEWVGSRDTGSEIFYY